MFVVGEQYSRRKTTLQMRKVARAASILQQLFDRAESLIAVGMYPAEFRRIVTTWAREAGATMSGNQISFCRHGYVHPPVDENTPLRSGEVFTLDMWLSWQGWYADLARPYCLADADLDSQRLLAAALACQERTIQEIKVGKTYLSLVEAVQEEARRYDCYILEDACGHGIGRNLHEEPMISFSYAGKNLFETIPQGLVVTLEVAMSLQPCSLVEDAEGYIGSNNGQTVLYAEAMIALDELGSRVIGR